MITIVVPTRNRAYTLAKVLPSHFDQDLVNEVILVDDGGADETEELCARVAAGYPLKTGQTIKNEQRRGASFSREKGVWAAKNDYILFCDDDEYLEPGYAARCLAVLLEKNAAAVSGRRVYMRAGETPEQAVTRFGDGIRRRAPVDRTLLQLVNGAKFDGVVSVPFTNANIITKTELVKEFGFDPYYSKGNGYREETDYQLGLFLSGHDIFIVNDVHSIHLPMNEARSGGQRANRIAKTLWSIHYNNYFIDKYYARYKARYKLWRPGWLAKFEQAIYIVWTNFFRPPIYHFVTMLIYRAAK